VRPPGLRAPARVGRVAGAYLRLLFHRGTVAVLCLGSADILANWGVGDRYTVVASELFNNVRELATLVFCLPFLQWQGEGGRSTFPLPLDRTQHDLLRVACGTAWAAVCLAIPTAVETWRVAALLHDGPGFTGVYPAWYPVALFAAGITMYLLGSAVLLWFEKPGRILLLLGALLFVVPGLLPLRGSERKTVPSIAWTELLVAWHAERFARLSMPEQLAGVMLPLGFACALVYAAARLDSPRGRAWAEVADRMGETLRRRFRRGPLLGSPRRTAPPTGLRLPPSAATVARWHFELLRRRMTWPIFIALCIAWDAARIQVGAGGIIPRFPPFSGYEAMVATCWPVLVWIDERGPSREFDEALPVGRVKKRILHAAAGAAWLVLGVLILVAGRVAGAMAVGTLASPLDVPAWLWLGGPCGALILYFIGTIPTLLSHRPAMTFFLLSIVTLVASQLAGSSDPDPLSPVRAIAPFLSDGPEASRTAWWSYTAAACWLVVFAAAAGCVIAVSDPDGRRRAGNVARFLRSWRGRRPEPDPVVSPGAEARSGERGPDYIPHPL